MMRSAAMGVSVRHRSRATPSTRLDASTRLGSDRGSGSPTRLFGGMHGSRSSVR